MGCQGMKTKQNENLPGFQKLSSKVVFPKCVFVSGIAVPKVEGLGINRVDVCVCGGMASKGGATGVFFEPHFHRTK